MVFDPLKGQVITGTRRGIEVVSEGHIVNVGDFPPADTRADTDPLEGQGGFLGRITPGSDIGDILDSIVAIDSDGSV